VIRLSLNVHVALGVRAVVAVNRAIPAICVAWCLWKRSMRWSSSNPISVAVATRPYRETMPHRFVIKCSRCHRSSL
jgi:hypothetical protein